MVGTGVTIGSAEGIFTPSISISGILTAASLNITGVSTLTGIVTTGTDLFVGGDLYVQDDLRFDELRARNGIFSGFLSVVGVATLTGIVTTGTDLFVGRNLIIPKNSQSESLNITGVSTFVGIGTFEIIYLLRSTLTAGLIDGGAF